MEQKTATLQKFTYQRWMKFDPETGRNYWHMEADFSDGTHRRFLGWLSDNPYETYDYAKWEVV